MEPHGFEEMLALGLDGDVLVFDPFQAMTGDLPLRLHHASDGFGIACEGGCDPMDQRANHGAEETQAGAGPAMAVRAAFAEIDD
jgi:hypothetical protein